MRTLLATVMLWAAGCGGHSYLVLDISRGTVVGDVFRIAFDFSSRATGATAAAVLDGTPLPLPTSATFDVRSANVGTIDVTGRALASDQRELGRQTISVTINANDVVRAPFAFGVSTDDMGGSTDLAGADLASSDLSGPQPDLSGGSQDLSASSCDLDAQNCSIGNKCVPPMNGTTPICVPVNGNRTEGAICTPAADNCGPGLICTGAAPTCMRVCSQVGTCSAGHFCANTFQNLSGNFFGLCNVSCVAFGTCSGGLTCNRGQCTSAVCVNTTCPLINYFCGPASDGCGGNMNCGGCTAPSICGGGGLGQCGSSACTPRTCQQAGASCGRSDDGCGGPLICTGCFGNDVCAANIADVGGSPHLGCRPAGTVAVNAVCTRDSDCTAGTLCVSNVCRQMCNAVNGCMTGTCNSTASQVSSVCI